MCLRVPLNSELGGSQQQDRGFLTFQCHSKRHELCLCTNFCFLLMCMCQSVYLRMANKKELPLMRPKPLDHPLVNGHSIDHKLLSLYVSRWDMGQIKNSKNLSNKAFCKSGRLICLSCCVGCGQQSGWNLHASTSTTDLFMLCWVICLYLFILYLVIAFAIMTCQMNLLLIWVTVVC